MYKETSKKYKEKIYNPSIQSVINIYIDGKLLNPKYLLEFSSGCELFENELQLGSIPSQYVEMKIHKNAEVANPKSIRIEYGILVNDAITAEELNSMLLKDFNNLQIKSLNRKSTSFEIIPMGEYIVDDYAEENGNVFTIKALDNIIKLDIDNGYYDASELINKKGYATLGELAQDICNKKGLELETSSFLNSDKVVSAYDNQISARDYMSYIAEAAGGFCCASRRGKICFRKIGTDEVEIPLKLFKTYKFGEEYKISRVVYEDGVRIFKFGNETRNTLWIRQENLFIVDENQVQNIYNQINGLTINSFEGTVVIDPAIDIGDKIKIGNKYIIYQGEMSLSKRFIADIKSKISISEKQGTTVKKESQAVINRRIQGEINQIDGKIETIVLEQNETSKAISDITQTAENINLKLEKKTDNDNLIASINISTETEEDGSSMKLKADKIGLEGIVTANENFEIDLNGNAKMKNAEVEGKVTATSGKISDFEVKDGGLYTINSENIESTHDKDGFHMWYTATIAGKKIVYALVDIECDDSMEYTKILNSGISTPILTQTSLEESKKNFEKLESGLDIINNTEIYKYNLKSQNDNDKKHIGFVIGEGYKYSNEITSIDKSGKEVGVDTYAMVAVAYKAIQELVTEVQVLKTEIEQLKGGQQ